MSLVPLHNGSNRSAYLPPTAPGTPPAAATALRGGQSGASGANPSAAVLTRAGGRASTSPLPPPLTLASRRRPGAPSLHGRAGDRNSRATAAWGGEQLEFGGVPQTRVRAEKKGENRRRRTQVFSTEKKKSKYKFLTPARPNYSPTIGQCSEVR